MPELVITVRVQIPEGASVTVAGAESATLSIAPPYTSAAATGTATMAQTAPRAPQTAQDAPLPPWPGDTDMRSQAAAAFDVLSDPPEAVLHEPTNADWPAGKCPRHDRTWLNGARGLYCPAKADSPPMNAKGYCTLMPGQVWNGRRIPGGP